MIVRHARSSDLNALISLGLAMHAECETLFPAVEPERVAAHLDMTLANPGLALALVAEGDGLKGLLTAVAGDYAFSSEKRAFCDIWYVSPDARGGMAGIRLVKRFIEWSREIGARHAFIGTSTGIATAKTERLLARIGFEPLGRTFRMEL